MKNLIIAGIVALFATSASADVTLEMLNKRDDGAKMVYSPDITRIEVGEIIKWVPTSKGHNVEFIAGPDGWKAQKKSKLNKVVEMQYNELGVYLYQCTPHK